MSTGRVFVSQDFVMCKPVKDYLPFLANWCTRPASPHQEPMMTSRGPQGAILPVTSNNRQRTRPAKFRSWNADHLRTCSGSGRKLRVRPWHTLGRQLLGKIEQEADTFCGPEGRENYDRQHWMVQDCSTKENSNIMLRARDRMPSLLHCRMCKKKRQRRRACFPSAWRCCC